jgi:hypothetical protein
MPQSAAAPVFALTDKSELPIRSLSDWRERGGPKHDRQWQERASAMELARAWCEDPASGLGVTVRAPEDLLALFEMHRVTRGFVPMRAIAEHVTRLDDFRGEHRNHDLVLVGRAATGDQVTIAVEAKALESFGSTTVKQQILAGRKTKHSNIEARVEGLSHALFGRGPTLENGDFDPEISGLRYQLLTAAVGAAIEAKRQGSAHAMLLVHEFVSTSGDESSKERADHLRNFTELHRFAKAFGVADALTCPGIVELGRIHGTQHAPEGMPLLLGHLRTELRAKVAVGGTSAR